MESRPVALRLDLTPRTRVDVIDVARVILDRVGDVLSGHRYALYCSHHTTAGYLDQDAAGRLRSRRGGLGGYLRPFQRMFPEEAGYRHDAMEERAELSEAEKLMEPPNADAHLTFMAAGMVGCATYRHRPGEAVPFVDLDGVYHGRARARQTSIVAYDREEVASEELFDVPVSRHAIDSVNLCDPGIGLVARAWDMVRAVGVGFGRVDISLDPGEVCAGVTVNEYETLLMRHDLAEVLADPLRFALGQARRVLRDPRSVPAKSLGYARYDLVQVLNRGLEGLGLSGTAVERLVAWLMAYPAWRRLRFKRAQSLAVCPGPDGRPRLLQGRYQSPILIQWQPSPRQSRRLRMRLSSFA